MTYSAHCFDQGTLKINNQKSITKVYDTDRALAAYNKKSLEELVDTANDYDFVERPNGKIEKGSEYTIRKAKNDFK